VNEESFESVFEDFVTRAQRNLKILWPANGTTAPTESNQVTWLSSILANRGYAVFSEVPFGTKGGNGRIDLVAIHPELGEMILFEAKSDKPTDGKVIEEMTRDWERLASFTLADLPQNKAWVNGEGLNLKKHICISFWSEREAIIRDDNYPARFSHEPKIFHKWIADDVNIGVKFIFKSL
jgi:hypothetical protein